MLLVILLVLFCLSFGVVIFSEIKMLKNGMRKPAIILVVTYTVILCALYILTLYINK